MYNIFMKVLNNKFLAQFRQKIINNIRPDVLLFLSFAFVILTGSILLFLPISNKIPNNYLDALFTATSATCITGLITRITANQYTLFGQIVILFLIQIGGLGFMTFVSVFLLFSRAKLDFRERLLLKDALNKDNFAGLSSYIKSIVLFTFVVEGIGFLLIYSQLISYFGLIKGFFPSLFLAISAFCNAGLDTISVNSLIPYQTNIILNLSLVFLIIAGGLGFAVWFDLYHHLNYLKKGQEKLSNMWSHLAMHTRIVLAMTLALILGGTILIFIFEYANSLSHLSLFDKLLVSFFNSTTLRTAGFASIDYSIIHPITKNFMIFLMLIGGSPGGTAGGLKTTTIFMLFHVFIAQYNDKKYIQVFSREISFRDVCKAVSVTLSYVFFLFLAMCILTMSEKQGFLNLLFEASSAIATVGLSIGITPLLTTLGKIVIISLMLIGRVGPITVVFMFRKNRHSDLDIRYPHADILVG